MKVVIKPFHSLPCELEFFTINGKVADYGDFDSTFDHNEEIREQHSLGMEI